MSTDSQRSVFSYALFHWLNLAFIFGLGFAYLRTRNPAFGALLVGGEAAWLLAAPQATFFRRYIALREAKKANLKKAIEALNRQQLLSFEYKQRFRNLDASQKQIEKMAAENATLSQTDVLQPELAKTRELLDSFVRIAVAHKRLTLFLEQNPKDKTAQALADARDELQKLPGDSEQLLKDSVARRAQLAEQKLKEVERGSQNARALAIQLESIESTIEFLKAKIMTMNRPEELAAQIDSVLEGVHAAERTMEETDKIEEEIRQMQKQGIGR